MTTPTMLTIKQVAERTGLAQHYIRSLCWQGKICFCRAGNKYLIHWQKFIEYLDRGENPASMSIEAGRKEENEH